MSVGKPWSFGKENGFTGSAAKDKVQVSAHERAAARPTRQEVQAFAAGGKVQKHYDRMEPHHDDQEADDGAPDVKAAGGKPKKFMKKAFGKNPGALHKALGVAKDKKIPAAKLAKAERSKSPLMRKRAALAEVGKKVQKKAAGGKIHDVAPDHTLGIPGGDGTKNVVGFRKGGGAKKRSHGEGPAAKQAAGALTKIAQVASMAGQPGAASGAPMMPPPPGMGGGMPPGGAPPGMRKGGGAHKSHSKSHKKK